MRQSIELTRKQLISMVGALRGSILDSEYEDREYIYKETAFDLSPDDDPGNDRSWHLTPEDEL